MDALCSINDISFFCEPEWAVSNWQGFCIILKEHIDRNKLMQLMLDKGIATRKGVMCVHREAPYRTYQSTPLPVSEHIQDHGIMLPLYHTMSGHEQQKVIETFLSGVTACS